MRLRRSDTNGPGLRRVRAGRGFRYPEASAADRERITGLVIPPAWTDVWISPHPNGHIQATGVDAAGRRQYLYHPAWREQKDRVKFERAMALAATLPAARRRVTMDLRSDVGSRQSALAAAFRMLDSGSLRVGSERYADEHGSLGLSTLLCSNATVRDDTVTLDFPSKSGTEWSSEIRDADLAAVIRSLKRRGGGARLLAYREGGRWHPLDAAAINGYVKERTGGDFTAKDFRTLHGTVIAAVSLAKVGRQRSDAARRRAIRGAVQATAELLGNTPAVARGSYIDPRLIDEFEGGHTIDPARPGSAEAELRSLLVH